MSSFKHALVGAAAAVLPDLVLFTFAWRKQWLPEDHKLVKLHRFIHSPAGLVLVWCVAWSTHIVLDWFSHHNTQGGSNRGA
jgi:hypothetical protein